MLSLNILSPPKLASDLARRVKTLRLRLGWSRRMLAAKSGVTTASIKRFELTGKISLERLLKLALVMDARSGWSELFKPDPGAGMTLRDLERLDRPLRQRGRTERP